MTSGGPSHRRPQPPVDSSAGDASSLPATISATVPSTTGRPRVAPARRKEPPAHRKRWPSRRRLAIIAALVSLPVLLLAVAYGVLLLRLEQGPIQATFLKDGIERQIAAETGGSARIDGVFLRLTDSGHIGVALNGLSVSDASGVPLIQAPQALVTLSRDALLSATLAVERVELVSPRLQIAFLDDGTPTLRFARSGEPAEPRSRSQTPPQPATASPPATDGQQLDLVRILTSASEAARRRDAPSAYLRTVGLRQATIVVDAQNRKSIWRVPELRLDLRHRSGSSRISGAATLESLTGPWSVAFQTTEITQSDAIDVTLNIRGLNPRGLARLVPALSLYEGLDLPLTGQAKVELSRLGVVRSAHLSLEAAPGRFIAPGMSGAGIGVDRGLLDLSYDGSARRLAITRATFGLGASRIELTGEATSAPAGDGQDWAYDLRSVGGLIAENDGKASLALEQLRIKGRATPSEGRVVLDELVFRAGGTEIAARGDIVGLGGGSGRDGALQGTLDGRIGAMPLSTLRLLWPASLAPGARAWVAANVSKGLVNGGNFRLASSADPTQPARMSLTLEGTNTEVRITPNLPRIDAPRLLVRMEGNGVEVTAPEATMATETRRIALRTLRFTSVEAAQGDQPTGEIAFRLQAPVAAIAEIIDKDQALQRGAGLSPAAIEGRTEGNVKLTFPLADNIQLSEVRLDGRLRVADLRVRNVMGFDVSGGTLNIDLGERAIDARGDILLRGVNAKVAWQYLLDAPPERQPPFRLTATLDAADRTQLGLDVNDEIIGDLPVEVTVQREASGALQTRVRADLTKAELKLDVIAWRKPPGRAATFQFDPVRTGNGAQARTELLNVRLVGDDVAVEGTMIVGADNKLREFNLPDFSVNVVTRLEVQGRLRPDFVWDVRAKGPTFDARDLFRALLNVSQAEKIPTRERPGLDLTAEVDTVLGFADTSLKGMKVKASRRNHRFTAIEARATHEDGKPFAAILRSEPKGRVLMTESRNAGHAFRMMGFYPNAVGGQLNLEVQLDATGVNEKTGTLWAQDFSVLGDPVVSELLQNAESAPAQPGASAAATPRRRVVRQQYEFDRLKVPFSIGSGQFVFNDAYIRGPLIGATMRGKVDFRQQTVNIGGTYVPLSGLNSAIGAIPVLGQLLAGPQGEGVLGITFAVQGPSNNPQVVLNPFSFVAPGIFREIFQMTPEQFRVDPRRDAAPPPAARRPERAVRSSSAPPDAPSAATPAAPAGAEATPKARAPARPTAKPEVIGDWSSEVKPNTPRTTP